MVAISEKGRQISFDRDFSKPWWFEYLGQVIHVKNASSHSSLL